MSLELQLARLAGVRGERTWSQVLELPSAKPSQMPGWFRIGLILESRPVLTVIRLSVSDGKENVAQLGREVVSRLEQSFEEKWWQSAEELGQIFSEFVKGERRGVVEVVAVGFEGDKIAIVAVGGGGVYLWREDNTRGKASRVPDGNPASRWGWLVEPEQGKVAVMRGTIRVGDRLVLGTREFFQVVSADKWTAGFSSEKASETVDQAAAWVQGAGREGVAGIVVMVGETDDEEVGIESEKRKERWVVQNRWQRIVERVPFSFRIKQWRQRRRVRPFVETQGKRGEPEVYVKSERRRRVTLSVAVVVLGLLVVSVGLGWRARRAEEQEKILATLTGPARERLNQAREKASSDALGARVLIGEVRDELTALLPTLTTNSNEYKEVEAVLKEVEAQYQLWAREWEISEASLFYDLTLIRPDFFGQRLVYANEKVVTLDTGQAVVAVVEVGSKNGRVVGGGELLAGASFLGMNEEGRVVVVSDRGLVAVWLTGRPAEVLVEKDEEWVKLVALGTFGGNVYLVEESESELWRYPGLEGGVGERRRWLGPGVIPDFSQVVDMAVDGDIWLLSKNGTVSRYRQGAPLSFTVKGLDEPIGEGVAIEVSLGKADGESDEEERVYILDRGQARVVVLNKNGEYVEQYRWQGIRGVTDLAVDTVGKRMLLLSGKSIYEIPLKK